MRRILAGLSLLTCMTLSAAAVAGDLPDWQQLSPVQRDVLAPLGGDWNHLDDERRRKWLELAERFPSMTPAEQARMRARMSYWSSLTPEERVEARERYKRLQSMPPEKREALARQWEAYEGLSREERKSLNAGQRPVGKMPGAATAAPVRK
jgi:hypothetical protein